MARGGEAMRRITVDEVVAKFKETQITPKPFNGMVCLDGCACALGVLMNDTDKYPSPTRAALILGLDVEYAEYFIAAFDGSLTRTPNPEPGFEESEENLGFEDGMACRKKLLESGT